MIYQWKFEGADIPGATTPSLTLTNLTLAQCGVYGLTISNAFSVATTNITLLVLIKPVITNQPVAQTVLQGASATFTITAGPSHPLVPLWYRWIRNGSGCATSSVPLLVITNVQASALIRVAVTNAASPNGVSSSPVNLTMIPDVDGDGMADAWEVFYFGTNATNTASNALLDPDGDGMSNRDEYLAGTNPTNATSVLKLVLTATNANVLQFVAQTNLGYSVQYRTNLSAGLWNTQTSIIAQSQVRTVQVNAPNPPPDPQRYYRIVTPPAP